VTDRPIIMHPISVRALDAGRKTQTRRILKPQPIGRPWHWEGDEVDPEPQWFDGWEEGRSSCGAAIREVNKPLRVTYAVGDRLWVREAWAHDAPDLETCRRAREDALLGGLHYGPYYLATEVAPTTLRWRPSIHMPRWASRFTLTVTEVRVHRLQEISEKDARAEGIEFTLHRDPLGPCKWASAINESRAWNTPVAAYKELWDKLHGPGAWGTNPLVVAITFKTRKGNIDRV